jgi:hypothetical protein
VEIITIQNLDSTVKDNKTNEEIISAIGKKMEL